MFKILYWLLFDAFFLYALVSFGSEMGGYIVLVIAAIAFFTWEMFCAIRNFLNR